MTATTTAKTISAPIEAPPRAEAAPAPLPAAPYEPLTASQPKAGSLLSHGWILGVRSIRKTIRNPSSIIEAMVVPVLFFFLYNLILQRVMEARGLDYQQMLPPTIVVEAVLLAAISSASYVADDRMSGVMSRLRSLPIHRAAPLFGRSVSDLGRAFVGALLITGLGVLAGMEFERGWSWAPAFFGVTLLFGLAVSIGMGLIGYKATTPEGAASIASAPYLPLIMLSSGFAPVEDFPDWMEPVVRYQPVTAVIDALRALAGNGDITSTVPLAIAWSIGLIVAFLGPRCTSRRESDMTALSNHAPMTTALAAPTVSVGGPILPFAGRAIRKAFRASETVVNTVIFPILLLWTMIAAFGPSVEAFEEGAAYAQRLVPTLTVAGIMFGSFGAAFGLLSDLQSGFMDRICSLPGRTSNLLFGAAMGEMARGLVGMTVIASFGAIFDFRFQGGALSTIAYVGVAALVGPILVWIPLSLATVSKSLETLGPPLNAVFIVLVFTCGGMVPLAAYPDWAKPFVEQSPITAFVALLDGLARGGPVLEPAIRTALFATAILVIFGGIAMYRVGKLTRDGSE